MIAAPASAPSLFLVEGLLTLITVVLAVGLATRRKIGKRGAFRRIEISLGHLARRRFLCVVTVGLSALLLRIALLPFCPIPQPYIPDEFSFLLSGDTFAHGRLSNPTPELWEHFETIHETMLPTYQSMYFPAQGLILAAGQTLFGNPWFGLLVVNALFCAALCWMLQAWLPPGWALLGGALALLRLSLFSYWINSFNGGAAVAALGGTLVLGAFPRVMKNPRLLNGLVLALGIVVLMLSRPYEGLILCLPVSIALAHWVLRSKTRPASALLIRNAALPIALVLAGIAWLGYYDYRAFGSPTTLPYTIDRATYAIEPYWIWQPPRPEPNYRHAAMRDFYVKQELPVVLNFRTPAGFIRQNLLKPVTTLKFYAGLALLPPLFMLGRVVRDRRTRFLVIGVSLLIVGLALEIVLLPHYIAPFTAAFYAIGLQAARHLRVFQIGNRSAGLWMVRGMVLTCIAMAGLRTSASTLHLPLADGPPSEWTATWYGTGPLGESRAQIRAELERAPGKQIVLVRYTKNHDPVREWVYNDADFDQSKILWAREMDPVSDKKLLDYYHDRKAWLLEPDATPIALRALAH